MEAKRYINTNPEFGEKGPFEGTKEEIVESMQECFESWANDKIGQEAHIDANMTIDDYKEWYISEQKKRFIDGLEHN